MKKWLGIVLGVALASSATAACTSSASEDLIRLGAVYPVSGSQGPSGTDEHRGVLLAADLANQDGGVNGRLLQLRSVDVPTADAAPQAIQDLQAGGIQLVLGSHGSTISAPAS